MGKDQELFDSCRDGDIVKVESLLCSRNRRPRTPLSFLRNNGVGLATCRDPNTGYTALHISALNGHGAVVRCLLSYHSQNYDVSSFVSVRDRRGCLPLHLAAWNGHMDAVGALVDVDPNCRTVNTLNNAKETPLHLAAQHGHVRVTGLLLKHHADSTARNARGETALDLAARFGRTSVTRLLVSHCPSLILCAASNEEPVTSVSCPASPICSTYPGAPCSPLHLAARNGHLDIVQFLVDSGFDINWITEEGSALHVAALFGKTKVVKCLLQKGISLHNRDWQGRNVLEVLEEHQNQRSMDLTQLMQNKEAWAECRHMIEEKIAQRKTSASEIAGKTLESMVKVSSSRKTKVGSAQHNGSVVSSSARTRYQNFNQNPSRKESSSPVWQKIPESAAQEIIEKSTRSKSALCSKAPIEDQENFRPLSVQELRIRMDEEEKGSNGILESFEQDQASTISLTLTPTIQDPCSVSPSVASTISSAGTFTSDNFQNVTPVKPPRRSKRKDLPVNTPAMCNYKAPTGYDSWAPPPGKPHPLTSYDNVPSNLLVYDNAPPPGHKRWEHVCEDSPNDGEKTNRDQDSNGALLIEGEKEENSLEQQQDRSVIEETIDFITKSCSDIEESLSANNSLGPRSPGRVKFAENVGENDGKAPLAMPELTEDLGGSTTTEGDVGQEGSSASASGHATPGSRSEDFGTGDRKKWSNSAMDCSLQFKAATPDDPPPSAWASESKIFEKFYPHGEELSRYSSASARSGSFEDENPSIREQETQADGGSVSSSEECSENCSCRDRDSPPEKEEVSSVVDQSVRRKVVTRFGNRSSSATQNRGTATGSPLDESAEWQKINDIMESFGGGICRESVFSERYEPRVAVFLQNRKSAALTLTMGDNNGTGGESLNSKVVLSPTSGLSQISKWLKGLGIKSWSELARNFEWNGFEKIEFLRDCINRDVLSNSLDVQNHDIQNRILDSLSSLPEFPEKAKLRAHNYVSDWLLSMGCQDYLGNFMKTGLDSVQKIWSVSWNERKLKELGIYLVGHVLRILTSVAKNSIPMVQDSSVMWSSTGISPEDFEENGALIASVENTSSYSNPSSSAPLDEKSGLDEGEEELVWKHDPSELISGSIGYSAHYLGSTLVENLEGSDSPRRAIAKLKKSVREIAKVPQILMNISYRGVRLSDASTKQKICDHAIHHIHCVCQDERDLNCFAYITKDGERHFCHVFCVLTADVATEIILSLGQAFEVAYQLATKNARK